MYSRPHLPAFAAAFTLLTSALHAQVPQLINYQGRVAVGTVNFNGEGKFKFALVTSDGTKTYWSNDGTSNDGSEPSSAVTLTVTRGLYSVLLGDATLPEMTIVPATVFTNMDVHLRVWFDDGTNGSQLLTPDQRIAAVGYAMMAGNVSDGAITGGKIAPGAVGSSQLATGAAVANIAAGSISGVQLAPGAAVGNLNAGGQSGVPSGGLVLSATENSALLDAGYVRIGVTLTTVEWRQRIIAETTPAARSGHTAVWTGSEMIVWGGSSSHALNTGGRYNPSANDWTAVTTTGPPTARVLHTAVWTGSEMIVWGGVGTSGVLNDGGRYHPAVNNWTTVSAAGAPSARRYHTAVWTGSGMIVWGGWSNSGSLNDGGHYHPAGNNWTEVSTSGAPAARGLHTAVWTGSQMIVWGGSPGVGLLNTGGRYNPAGNSWTAVNITNAPVARGYHTAVWTGTEMIVWGGQGDVTHLNTGGRYDPAGNTWSPTPVQTIGAPSARVFHTTVWTGSEMIVWGGEYGSSNLFNDGARFDPAGNSWTAMNTTGVPRARSGHTAVWTGSEMIVWGGYDGNFSNETFSYSPGRALYLYQRP